MEQTYTNQERLRWRKLRREKEISQAEIAAFLGCAPQHINQWELKDDYLMSSDKVLGYMQYIEEDLGKK